MHSPDRVLDELVDEKDVAELDVRLNFCLILRK
jgi:hypothetical protein